MPRQKEFDRTEALDAALGCFWRGGYEATSVQDLVDTTGLNRSSLYDTFGDKRALYLETLRRYQEAQTAAAVAALDAPGSPKAAIRSLVLRIAAECDGPGCFMVNSALERAAHDADVARIVGENYAVIEAAWAEAIRRAQAAGEVPAGRDASALARFFVATVFGLRVTARSSPDPAAARQSAEIALSLLDGP